MLSFLSRLRLTSSAEQTQDDGDDTSSNRSLSLPWPVTESSTRRPTTSTSSRREWTPGQPPPQASGMTISYPIPRSQPNSLTGFNDYNPPSPGLAQASAGGHIRPARAAPPQPPGNLHAWNDHGKQSNQLNQSATGAETMHSPPEVVRLHSQAFIPEDGYENVEDSPPPRYAAHQDVSSSTYPIQTYGYTTTANAERPTQTHASASDRDEESELYNSPFDSDADDTATITPRSSGNTTTTSLSSITRPSGATMPKSKWGLRLQLHSAQSMPSLSAGAGVSQHPLSQGAASLTHPPHDTPLEAGPYPLAVSVDTDVYKHAYNYPMAKQLSPIPEQDYFSPVVESPKSRYGKKSSGSLRKPSPAESLGSLLGGVRGKGDDVAEKESPKMRNGHGRSGSGGSVATINGNTVSRAGSIGSEITRPSPIYASPFLTRHLNRTISQSSSKSDSQSPATHPPTPATSQPPIGAQGQAPVQAPITARPTAGTTHVSAVPRSGASNSMLGGKETVQTPTSAATSGTTGTMFTPTSTLQTPTAASPVSPNIQAGTNPSTPSVIQPLPTAMIVNAPSPPPRLTATPPANGRQRQGFPKIPSLPNIPPLDLRFSILGSVGPRGSREIRDRTSKATITRKSLVGNVQKMPVIEGSAEGYYEEEIDEDAEGDSEDEIEEEDDDDDYDRESLHAESFVTAGTNENAGRDGNEDQEHGVELKTLNNGSPPPSSESMHSRAPGSGPPSSSGSAHSVAAAPRRPSASESVAGESFIDRRWERDAALGLSSSPTTFTAKGHNTRWPVRFSKPRSSLSPAFWAFWLGFIFPVLWLLGGWHFTNAGELPPKITFWEWYFWNSSWSFSACLQGITHRVFGCCVRRKGQESGHKLKKIKPFPGSQDSAESGPNQQRRKGKRRSRSQSNVRAGQVYPALPRWVAEKQSSDDGRMRLNDPKRSLRGISFGYPFIARPPATQDSAGPVPPRSTSSFASRIIKIIAAPNRVLDLLYGVKLMEVRGRPESGRRMFDPWIQRCRYALCYGLLLLAAGLCTASVYLIAVNTRKIV